MPDQPTDQLIAGRYEVVGTLGQGAFGRTFLARDREGGADVAIKMLDAARAPDLKSLELFEREAAVLRSLRHHGIPQVHATMRSQWEGHDASFFVMEYVEGMPLSRLIAEQRHLDPAEVLHLFFELLGILEYLHGRMPPLLHRDIKPSNIIVRPDGSPVLVDFGAVRRVYRNPEETGSTIVGTHGFMPYEQFMGQASAASDLYALAATMLNLVTGRPPADFMVGDGQIEIPATLPGDKRLRAVIGRLLQPAPGDRYQSAREVRMALLGDVGIEARALPVPGTALVTLPPAPRAIVGPARELHDKLAWSGWQLMDSATKPENERGLSRIWDLALFGFFSVLTAGVLPITFFSMASTRRRRLKRFFVEGIPASATITDIDWEVVAFEVKMARVKYEFQADGQLRRDADLTLPVIANRWRVGDRIDVLYLPYRNYDSLIVSQ